MIIGLTGSLAAGKGVVSDFLKENGFDYLSLSNELREIAKERKIELTRENLQDLGNNLREESGSGVLAEKILLKIKNQNYNIKIFENLLDNSENFALIKGNLNKNKNPRVRVISSNIVKNYLMGEKLPTSFNQTIEHFKNHKDCVLIFIRDSNLKSVSETLREYKSKKFYKSGEDKLIKNYGIGAQIIKALNIKNMILVTRSKKKEVGLDGYGIKITKQEIIK